MKDSTRSADWLTVGDAVDRILAAVRPLPAEVVSITDCLGRVLAETVHSPLDQPPWDNSAMDGYAVRASDIRNVPVVLDVVESIAAGEFPALAVGKGQATRIMTGAPLPAGADCVVRVEHTRVRDDGRVEVFDGSDAGRNVRVRGEDTRAGDVVMEAGRWLRPGEVGVLAAVGRARVAVHRRPRVAILSTGDELVDLDRFDEVMAGRRIANSNSYALAAAVLAAGGEPRLLGIARDDAADLREHIEAGLLADALITSAGASVGDHDVVKDVLEELGFGIDFWRVRMRPGSPASFGTLPRSGRDPLPVFGLPGNPVSVLVTYEVLVRPALRRMQGRQAVHSRTMHVRAAEPIGSKAGLIQYLRVRLEPPSDGGPPLARLTGPQGSGLLTSMAKADALLVVPEQSEAMQPGEEAVAIPLDSGDEAQHDLGY